MPMPYGFAKATVTGDVTLQGSNSHSAGETQYHLHAKLDVAGAAWDVAINVGTDDRDDLLFYKLVSNYGHPILDELSAAAAGRHDLAGTEGLPALDYQRSDLLEGTGDWLASEVMDGSDTPQPVAAVKALLERARDEALTICLFGRFYKEGDGIHDTHMNQGSSGKYIHRPQSRNKDGNDVWQDGALLVDLGASGWTAYFAAFQNQKLPTDDLGNPQPASRSMADTA